MQYAMHSQARAMFRLALQFLYESDTPHVTQKTLADKFGVQAT
jgi:hypothetical protein